LFRPSSATVRRTCRNAIITSLDGENEVCRVLKRDIPGGCSLWDEDMLAQ